MISLATLVLALTILATSVMAASAAVQAVRFEFDFFGAIFLGLITAVGGGTIRDLLIGAAPVFWISDLTYITTATPVAALTYMAARKMSQGSGKRAKLLLYFDAIGLALFTLIGLQTALDHGISPAMAILLGCITGIGGGMIRDILCGLTPIVLKSDIYATLSLIGGTLFIALAPYLQTELRLITAFLFITLTRIIIVARAP